MQAAEGAFLLWAILTVVGAAVVALPDDDRRAFSLTSAHGPAAMDLVGIGILGLGLPAYLLGVHAARARIDAADVVAAAAVYVPSMGLVAWSVATDRGWWWTAGVAAALAVQAWFARRITRPEAPAEALRPST